MKMCLFRTSSTIAVCIALAGSISLATASSAQAQGGDGTAARTSNDVIVVTSRRREESLQDVPLSVSAFGEAQLEDLQASDISALQNAVPNLTMHTGDAENAVIYIRGVGQVDSLAFAEPGVGVYLDDVYLARTQGAILDVFDVERVEVLRGPQGTLYGRNTIGGAVRFISTRPGSDPGARLELGAGNHGQLFARARMSGDLVDDRLAGKAALFYSARDGYSTNEVDGSDDGDVNRIAGRLGFLFMPTDDVELELTVEGASDSPDTSRTPARMTDVAGIDPATGTVSIFAAQDDPYAIRASYNDLDDLSSWGVTARAQWQVSDALSLTSITGQRTLDYDSNLDLDGTELEIFEIFVREEAEQFSQEFRAEYDAGGALQLTGGVYYFDDQDTTFNGLAGSAIALPLGGGAYLPYPLQTASINDQNTEAWAAYFDASYALSDRLRLSGGLRYTSEDKSFTRLQEVYAPGTSNPPPFQTGAGIVATDIDTSETFDALTPRIGLDYRVNDAVMLYGLASRGFKSGGFDGRSNTPFDANPYDPEFVWSYEAGIKSTLMDGELVLNAAVFRNDYTDLQLSSFTANPGTGAFEAQFTNAGEAVIQGVEAEAMWRPADGLTLTGHVGYMDAFYEEYIGAGGVNIADDRELVNTPELSGGIAFTYEWPVSDNLYATVHADASWRSKTYTTVSSAESLAQDGYALVNAFASIAAADERWEIRAGVRNLFDEAYINQAFDLIEFPGYQLAYYGAPRTFDIRLVLRTQ
ncbi:TonB-dependent receptor [Maricaulis maris]|uniref:Iron complex outermembrane receptor protein n=1 Tax=Maricaulis maris TaxID=74318 RepID=A0A495DLK4_9PROT|nr:TonB-dependent receptor [Maricaulis maris]RKR03817.1 iron complex outermembrane receptor protein [Maricaulis maris]